MGLPRKKRLFGAGVGAGLLGAIFLALRYAVRPVTKAPVPEAISPAIFRTKVLHTSLGQMVYHESGSGAPLVFIHSIGPGASSYEWSKVYPEFTASHRVLAPDLIGFGESARPDAHLTSTDYARSIAEFIRATCDQPATVIGSGLGAGLAVLLANQHPELVSHLLLWMPTGLTEHGVQRIPMSRRFTSATPLLHRFIYRNYESSRGAIRVWLATQGFADAARISAETLDVYATCAQQSGAEHALRNLYAGRLNVDIEQRLAALAQPVTMLWPELLPDHPSEIPGRLQALARASRLRFAGPFSRLAAIEGPAEIATLLTEELDPRPRVVR
jgi:pimeloyl-ACP methyl ester carboxylesterase